MTEPELLDLFPPSAVGLLDVKGKDLVEKLGEPAIRDIVAEVLCGVNLRNATEALTRRRVGSLNAALLVLYVRARDEIPGFPASLPSRARSELLSSSRSPVEKKVLWWLLGLTKKQIDNVLRNDAKAWGEYLDLYAEDLVEVAAAAEEDYGGLSAELEVRGTAELVNIDWLWAVYLLSAVGSQTLATRGSEKSIYGKLFEKLVLGGVLHAMGFRLVEENDVSSSSRVFWLSSRGNKRESDATALFAPGVGVRFDIGFIGRGNSEISLDKVSRFEREIDIGGESIFMHTFIIVDTIGTRSRITELASAIEGTILQMSASYWPRELGEKLAEVIDEFESPFDGMDDAELHNAIQAGIADAPFRRILELASTKYESEDSDLEATQATVETALEDEGGSEAPS